MAFVLDCSVTMAWVFPDEATEGTNRLRELLVSDSAFVPCLWSIEVTNVLLAATRRRRIVRDDWSRVVGDLAALPIVVDAQPHDVVFRAVLPLADRHGLSAYDAMYLELAVRRGLPLATLDEALAQACTVAGIEVL